jgi:hypothetical protein
LGGTEGRLSTRYGVPNYSDFSQSIVTYYINPKASPVVYFARPSLLYGSNDESDWDGYNFAVPSNIWNPDKGFLTQSTDPLHYDKNFPITGADGLYFYLDIGGVDPSTLSWPSVTHGEPQV